MSTILESIEERMRARVAYIEAELLKPDVDSRKIAVDNSNVHSLKTREGMVAWEAVALDWHNVEEVEEPPPFNANFVLMTRRQFLLWRLCDCKNTLRAFTH